MRRTLLRERPGSRGSGLSQQGVGSGAGAGLSEPDPSRELVALEDDAQDVGDGVEGDAHGALGAVAEAFNVVVAGWRSEEKAKRSRKTARRRAGAFLGVCAGIRGRVY